jgi:hypothetical protein
MSRCEKQSALTTWKPIIQRQENFRQPAINSLLNNQPSRQRYIANNEDKQKGRKRRKSEKN